MELRNIFTFLRVAEIGSFTKTAEELGYSQSTITIQIKQLESELGVPLFDRIGKKISLTPMGAEFISYANEIMQTTSKIKEIGIAPYSNYNTFRVGILESLFVWKFSDLIPQFQRELPLTSIETKSAAGVNLYQMLRRNELDIIFVLDKKSLQKDCVRACASPVKIVFVTSQYNPLTKEKNIPLAAVAKQPLILTERDSTYRRALEEVAGQFDIKIDPFLEVDNSTIILKLLKKSLGVSFLPEYIVRDSIVSGELCALDVNDCEIELWSQVFYHKSKWVTPQMKLFIKLIQELDSE